jgi:ribonucleoside-diphosphate reductase alpha chain
MQKENYLGIEIDYELDKLIPEQGIALLTGDGFYKKEWEESPQESFARASTCYSFGDNAFAQRIYNYVSKQWFMFASPVLSNAVEVCWPNFEADEFSIASEWLRSNVKPDGLPISCFLSYVGDSKEALVSARAEASWLSMMGGGVGIYMGNRSPDRLSTGVMSHLRGYDSDTLSYRQTATRRGSMAAYMDVNHPEIASFIQMRNPTGGDQNKKCFNINNAVNITDEFMQAVIDGKEYELIDPKHGKTGKFLDAREVWEELLRIRYETGEPYMFFIDTANRNKPSWITKPTYHVKQSNLCSEITLMTSVKRTAVCCLSSINLEKWDEYKNDPLFFEDLVRLLDNVLEYFIQLAPPELHRAVYSAKKERAIGLGTFGFNSYLQSKMIPFESGFFGAVGETEVIYKHLKSKAVEASKKLASERGEPDDCAGSGMRNSHLLAIAPNASSASLVGASPSIEPWAGNAFTAQGRAGSFLVKNKYLEELLEQKGQNTPEVWSSIIFAEGSVQGLNCLTDEEKKVFATAREISPMWIVELAATRQLEVCQSQSVNIFTDETTTIQELSDIHMKAWLRGLKSLYYCRAKSKSKAQVGTGSDKPLNAVPVKTKIEFEECLSCQG